MPQSARPSSQDPLGRFEPGWSRWFLAVWLAALVALAVVRNGWPGLLSYQAGVRLAAYWTLGFFGVSIAVAAIAVARRRWLARAEREKLCVECGYDLRASPGACPECGAEQSPGSPAAADPNALTDPAGVPSLQNAARPPGR